MPAELPLVYVLGDSISMHYGPSLEAALRQKFRYARKTAVEVDSLGLDIPPGPNGGDSNRVVLFLERMVSRGCFRPDILLVNCGLHDIRRPMVGDEIQVDAATYRANLRRIIALARQIEALLVWVLSTNVIDSLHARKATETRRFNSDMEAYNQIAIEEMRAAGVPVIDLNAYTRGLEFEPDIFPELSRVTEIPVQTPGNLQAATQVALKEAASAIPISEGDPGSGRLDAGEALFADHVHFVDSVRKQQGEFLAEWILSHFWQDGGWRVPEPRGPVKQTGPAPV